MAMWSSRSFGYKLGVSLLFLGSAFYLIGYASPNWYDMYFVHFGLWQMCYRGQCQDEVFTEGWFKVVQTLQSLGMIGLAISCFTAIVINCCQTGGIHCRCLEFVSFISGLTGFVGAMVFIGKTSIYTRTENLYAWGFGLNLAGCILVIITAIIIFYTNSNGDTAATSCGDITQAGPSPVTMQQGQNYLPQRQNYPPQGQGYYPQGQSYPQHVQGYPSQGQGYPQHVQDYPSQGQSYPQHVQGYPSQGQSYPQHVQGYPSQGQSYPQHVQGYPSQGQGYPSQRHSYPSQGQEDPPQGQGYPPQVPSCPPQIPSCPPPYGAPPEYSQVCSDAPPPYPGYVTAPSHTSEEPGHEQK